MIALPTAQVIREASQKLQPMGLTNFIHSITYASGQISLMMGNEDVFMHYYKNKIPTFCTDAKGRTLEDGVYLNKTLENTRADCALLMPRLIKIGRKYGQNYGKNSLHIVTREENCENFYCLFFDLDEMEFLQWIINNGQVINDFIDGYNLKYTDVIQESKAIENRIVLPTAIDFFQTISINAPIQVNSLPKIIHKHLAQPIHFTPQEGRCLQLLMTGNTAKEVALKLNISYRTVETYFDKLRKKMGCATNKKLVAEYGDQLIF